MDKIKRFFDKTHFHYILLFVVAYILKGIGYFGVQKIPHEPIHFNMAIDSYIPFIKYFYVFYISYYVLPFIFMYVISFYDKKRYWKLLISATLCNMLAILVFAFVQVQMIRQPGYDEVFHSFGEVFEAFKGVHNISEFFDVCVSMHYYLDEGALNCFPSLHAAFSTLEFICGLYIFKCEKKLPLALRIIGLVFGVGTCLSTMFIKQHYFVDVVAGVALYVACYVGTHFVIEALIKKGKLKFLENVQESKEVK